MSIPDKKTLQRRLGEALKRLREERNLSCADVAERMGKKRSAETQISRWERGEAAPIAHQVWGFLLAIDASFSDLDRQVNPRPASSQRLRELALELESLTRKRR